MVHFKPVKGLGGNEKNWKQDGAFQSFVKGFGQSIDMEGPGRSKKFIFSYFKYFPNTGIDLITVTFLNLTFGNVGFRRGPI